MRVSLVRHGEAVDPYEADTDGQRWLTARGRSTVRSVGGVVAEMGVRFDRIYTSPLVRAVQTAEILAATTAFDGLLEVWPALAGGTTTSALAVLDRSFAGDVVALVGHEPLIRSMAAQLLGAHVPGFYPGMMCTMVAGPERHAFEWAIDPRGARTVTRLEDLPK